MSDVTKIHRLFLENVNEENKKNEISNSIFQLNSKKNLISIAKETLRARNNKFNKINIKNIDIRNNQPEKIKKNKIISIQKKIKEKEDIKKGLIFSDKEYLNLMLNDLKSISSSIEKKQRRYNPTFSNNLFLKNKQNSFLSYDRKDRNRNKRKLYNKKMNEFNQSKTGNYNNINLLNQLIGAQEPTETNYESKMTVTEDNMDFNNLFFEKNTNEIFYNDNQNN